MSSELEKNWFTNGLIFWTIALSLRLYYSVNACDGLLIFEGYCSHHYTDWALHCRLIVYNHNHICFREISQSEIQGLRMFGGESIVWSGHAPTSAVQPKQCP